MSYNSVPIIIKLYYSYIHREPKVCGRRDKNRHTKRQSRVANPPERLFSDTKFLVLVYVVFYCYSISFRFGCFSSKPSKESVSLLSFSVRRFCNTRNKKNETSSHPMSYIYEALSSCQRGMVHHILHGRSSLQPFTLLL